MLLPLWTDDWLTGQRVLKSQVMRAIRRNRWHSYLVRFLPVEREEHWAIVDLVGKGGHIRTVPVPDWVRVELDDWLAAAAIDRGRLFRRVNKVERTWGDRMTVKAVWHIVKKSARSVGVARLAPHDLRRTCARLCHASGGELEQIQFLLGHVSVQTTERYLGCKQRIRSAVNDCIGIEPNP
jgi:integrase